MEADLAELLQEDLGHESHLVCDLFETVGSVPLDVEGGHVGKESLGGTDVTGGLVSSDVLLSGLESHSEGLISVGILGDTNDSSWDLSLKLFGGGKVTWMWSTIAERNTHSLSRSYGNVSAHCSWCLENSQRENIGTNCENHSRLLNLGGEFSVVVRVTKIVWGLYEHTTVLLGVVPVELRWSADDKVDSEGVALRLDDVDDLWESGFADEVLISLSVEHIVRQLASLSGRGGFVEKGGVCDVHVGEFHDSSLEVEERLESSLGDLGLVWSVRGVPLRVLKNISSDNTRGIRSIISLSDKTLVDDVVGGKLSHSFEHQGLRVDAFEFLTIVLESRFWRESNLSWDDFAHELFHVVNS